MPRPISLKLVLRILGEQGFQFVSQRGSHAKFRSNTDPSRTVIIKMSKKEIPHGTFQAILGQAGLSEGDFRKH